MGLYDFPLMAVTVLKKLKPRVINYRSCKHFLNQFYREPLLHELSEEVFVSNNGGLQRFCDININILNGHAPCQRKYSPANRMPFITKNTSKAIIKRSALRNYFL